MFDPEKLRHLFPKFGREYKKDDIIFCEFEPGDSLYVVLDGRVKVTKIVKDTEKKIDEFGPGEIFGEMAIIEEAPRTATAIAVEDTKLIAFDKQNFSVLMKAQPKIGVYLLKLFSRRIMEAKRRLLILLFQQADSRVMDTLLMMAELSGVDVREAKTVTLHTNPEDIAEWAAIPEDQCRAILEQMEYSGRIMMDEANNTITIKNIAELHRIVNNRRKTILKID